MKQSDSDKLILILTGFFFGLLFLADIEKKRKEREKDRKKRILESSFETDKENIQRDWSLVKKDIYNSFKKLEKETNVAS